MMQNALKKYFTCFFGRKAIPNSLICFEILFHFYYLASALHNLIKFVITIIDLLIKFQINYFIGRKIFNCWIPRNFEIWKIS